MVSMRDERREKARVARLLVNLVNNVGLYLNAPQCGFPIFYLQEYFPLVLMNISIFKLPIEYK